MRGIFHFSDNSAITSQQCRFFATRTAWQLIQLLRCREAIGLRLLVHDLRRRTTRVLHGRFRTRLIVTGRAAVAGVFATGLAVTWSTAAWAVALGRRSASGGAIAAAWAALTTLRLTAAAAAALSAVKVSDVCVKASSFALAVLCAALAAVAALFAVV